MKRDIRLYIDDIIESIDRIAFYTKDLSLSDFEQDDLKQDAIIRRISIIGEAVTQIPDTLKKKHNDIPWEKIQGMRNIIIHEYWDSRLDIIWQTVRDDLLPLKEKIKKLLKELE